MCTLLVENHKIVAQDGEALLREISGKRRFSQATLSRKYHSAVRSYNGTCVQTKPSAPAQHQWQHLIQKEVANGVEWDLG
jgi:hypothetical protein